MREMIIGFVDDEIEKAKLSVNVTGRVKSEMLAILGHREKDGDREKKDNDKIVRSIVQEQEEEGH